MTDIDQQRLGWEPIETSHWSRTAIAIPEFRPLTGTRTADVVVIGGGYTGLSAAIHAAENCKSVVLVEARQPGWAASGRNAAQVCPVLVGTTPAAIEKTLGREAGSRLLTMVAHSGRFVFDLIERYNIDCSPRPAGTILVARRVKSLQTAVDVGNVMADHGARIEIVDKANLRTWVRSGRYVGGVRYLDGGIIQPLSYARGMALAAQKLGVDIFGNSAVIGIEREDHLWRVRTANGDVLTSTVLVGVGAYPQGNLFDRVITTGYPVAAACLVSKPLPDKGKSILPTGGPVVDLDDPAVFSPIIDDEGRLVITVLAGGNVRTINDVAPFADSRLRKAFPNLGPLKWDRFWLGRMTVTPDHIPQIVRLEPGIYAATGCQGLGITYATCAGRELARLAAGATEADIAVPVRDARNAPMANIMPAMLRRLIFPMLNRIGA